MEKTIEQKTSWAKYYDFSDYVCSFIKTKCELVFNEFNKEIYKAKSVDLIEVEQLIATLQNLYKDAYEGQTKDTIKRYPTKIPRCITNDISIININLQEAYASKFYDEKNNTDTAYTVAYFELQNIEQAKNNNATASTIEIYEKYNKQQRELSKKAMRYYKEIGLNVTDISIGCMVWLVTKPADLMAYLNLQGIRIKSSSGSTVRAYYNDNKKQKRLNFKILVIDENVSLQVDKRSRLARADKRNDQIKLFTDESINELVRFECFQS